MFEDASIVQKNTSKGLREMGMILNIGRWISNELTERQQENWKITWEMRPVQKHAFLHRIVIGDEKLEYFSNFKHKWSYGPPSH